MNDSTDPKTAIWKTLSIAMLTAIMGWWSRQLTLEIPPVWFREDVRQNTEQISRHEERLDNLEKSDPYVDVVKRLIEIERRLDQK